MLPKKRRIERKFFPSILTKGKRYNSPHLFMYASRINSSDSALPSRFSFSVSKKVAKKAVDRNKYRRRGYSIIARHISKVKSGYLIALSFKKGIVPQKFSDLEKEILELLSSAGVWDKSNV